MGRVRQLSRSKTRLLLWKKTFSSLIVVDPTSCVRDRTATALRIKIKSNQFDRIPTDAASSGSFDRLKNKMARPPFQISHFPW
ncbi:hypothetical protein K470DRAFT_71036 [Piedraia hortae CBS 480.64]|uniref:Uncharacterized protein n=1 Tax=Piedraia hortae CBS 480.64 TaxID=1314780 RepID=A0A6A7C0P8_9PEZI|nr:hypothetical protein K470DRAFT_71036 [Piedraia hortae CBS 480.64]